MAKLAIATVIVLGLHAGCLVSPASAAHIGCGSVLVGGSHALDSDVGPCAASMGAAGITLIGAELDMAGFTVSCRDRSSGIPGVLLLGTGSQLRNGKVEKCFDGVHAPFAAGLPGSVEHVVEHVSAVENVFGFRIAAHRSRLIWTFAAKNTFEGYSIDGNRNQVRHSVALENACGGFGLNGSDNVLEDNQAFANGCDGFEIHLSPTSNPSNNRLARNSALNSMGRGFGVNTGQKNALIGNIAVGNLLAGIGLVGPSPSVPLSGASMTSVRNNKTLGNGGAGIIVGPGATNNTIPHNTAYGNVVFGGFDLQDDNPACDNNVWHANTFGDVGRCVSSDERPRSQPRSAQKSFDTPLVRARCTWTERVSSGRTGGGRRPARTSIAMNNSTPGCRPAGYLVVATRGPERPSGGICRPRPGNPSEPYRLPFFS